ncbi:uncharacterized protein GGS25DRAFT_275848 [Hypoxylon fragiforme]|uniref:uncharacterized protein n=1 Tax=Hypoxylon fragiforme TaxID=63214 RepID=UPI0020C660B3|nr:uncharacterized protein GGS25DRAFT_275848 [Hypoxylon fragiforme]KAI2608427.1 hypothetical protein GGS25DRAFT_275848 [Hypoxylon fragiforme]
MDDNRCTYVSTYSTLHTMDVNNLTYPWMMDVLTLNVTPLPFMDTMDTMDTMDGLQKRSPASQPLVLFFLFWISHKFLGFPAFCIPNCPALGLCRSGCSHTEPLP